MAVGTNLGYFWVSFIFSLNCSSLRPLGYCASLLEETLECLTHSAGPCSSNGFSIADPLQLAKPGRLAEEPLDQGPEVAVEHRQQRMDEIHLHQRQLGSKIWNGNSGIH